METVLGLAALVAGGMALLRHAAGIGLLLRYVRRARVRTIPPGPTPPISLLKPLYGDEPGLEENLRATLRQNYPEFEVLFLHERPDDPAVAVAQRVLREVPDVDARFVQGRAPGFANPKAAVLARGAAEARHGILAAADSDVRPDPLCLRDVAHGLAGAVLVSFVPVVFGTRGFWSRVAGLVVDTEGFLSLLLAGGQASTGATIGVRREALEAAGGFEAVGDAAADDYALGLAFRSKRLRLALARRAARLHAPPTGRRDTMRWAVRWARVVRTAAPGVYALGLALSLVPLLLLAAALLSPYAGAAWTLLAAHTAARAVVAVAVDLRFCWDGSLVRSLHLLPLLWVLEPAGLLTGLLGSTVDWRGRRYRLRGGRATLVAPPPETANP